MSRHGPDGGESMSYSDDSNGDETKQTSDPRPEQVEIPAPTGWMHELNTFLERAFTEADRATGC